MADEDKKLLRQSVGIVVKVAALFVVIVSTVMVMQYIQLKRLLRNRRKWCRDCRPS